MNTFKQLFGKFESIPTSTAWYIADLSEARGKQELFTRQTPQKLKALREHAMIESAISSNRIEGVSIDQSRVNTVVFGKKPVLDRNEEEVRGYRNALKWIHENYANIPLTEKTILELHRLSRGDIWDAGRYKEKDGDIIEKYPDGRTRVRFKTVTAKATPVTMSQLTESWNTFMQEQKIHPKYYGKRGQKQVVKRPFPGQDKGDQVKKGSRDFYDHYFYEIGIKILFLFTNYPGSQIAAMPIRLKK